MRSTHSAQVERWLGTEMCEGLSRSMRGWYGGPIPVANVPGDVWLCKDGDFIGAIAGGRENTLEQVAWDAERKRRFTAAGFRRGQGGGMGNLADVFSAQRQPVHYSKTGAGTTAGAAESCWGMGSLPPGGGAAAAAPGGTVFTSASVGALPFVDASAGRSLHIIGGEATGVNSNAAVLLYDRTWGVAKTMNSTVAEAVTGVPTRYQNTVSGSPDSAESNFLFPEVRTVLPATAHNWTVCTYTDQSGNVGATLPSVTGVSAAAVNRLDMPLGTWFAPLAAGDTGIRNLTQMQCSAAVATGAVDFVIGHPLGIFPFYSLHFAARQYGINSAFNFSKVFGGACLALLGLYQATSFQVWRGYIEMADK